MEEARTSITGVFLERISTGSSASFTEKTSQSTKDWSKTLLRGEGNVDEDGYNSSVEQTSHKSSHSSREMSIVVLNSSDTSNNQRIHSNPSGVHEESEKGGVTHALRERCFGVTIAVSTEDEYDNSFFFAVATSGAASTSSKAVDCTSTNTVLVDSGCLCRSRLSSSQDEAGSDYACADRHPLPMSNSDCTSTSRGGVALSVRGRNWRHAGCWPHEGGVGAGWRRWRRVASSCQPTPAGRPGSNFSWANAVDNSSFHYNADCAATPIGGHHITILQNGMFMKESCSKREERFYKMLKPIQEYAWCNLKLLKGLNLSLFFDDSDDMVNGNAVSDVSFDEGSDSDRGGNNTEDAQRWDWWMYRKMSALDGDSNGSTTSTDIGSSTLNSVENLEERSMAFSADEQSNWDILLPLVPFVSRFFGIYRVHFDAYKEASTCERDVVMHSANMEPGNSTCSNSGNIVDNGTCGNKRQSEAKNGKGEVRQMIVLEDLCNGFTHPCILDIKMGSRQYGLNPSETKLKSKNLKAALSTSMQYGVRLAGMRRWCPDTQQYETRSKVAGRYLTLEELRETIIRFMQRSKRLRLNFRRQVCYLRRAFLTQAVFRFFTSSLLFVYDADRPLSSSRIVMVDFAFTYRREELWRAGDPEAVHERDVGYIKALDTMLTILS